MSEQGSGAEPAYPWGDVTNGGVMGGLTKRELFAAMAMQGMLAGLQTFAGGGAKSGGPITESHIAGQAVEFADALLKALQP